MWSPADVVQVVSGLQQELHVAHTQLAAAKQDLSQDECIFADKQREISNLRVQLADLQQVSKQQQDQMTAQLKMLQQEANRRVGEQAAPKQWMELQVQDPNLS